MFKREIAPAPPVTIRFYEPRDRDAVVAIHKRRNEEWTPDSTLTEVGDPGDPRWSCVVVVADENDQPIAAMGARRVAELASAIDAEKLSPHQWRDVLARAWAKLAVALYRQGFDEVFCRVSSPTPAWGNMLQKRGQFFPDPVPHYYLDLEKAMEGARPK